MLIGQRLRVRLKQIGKSQAEVARKSGISARRFNHYVNDQREPDFEQLVRICEALETHPNYLFGFDGNPEMTQGHANPNAAIMRELAAIKAKISVGEDGE